MKTIMVTGASGYIGKELIKYLLHDAGVKHIIAVTSAPAALRECFAGTKKMTCVTLSEPFQPDFDWEQIDSLVHLKFARRFYEDREIAESLSYARNIFLKASIFQVPELIYVSSIGIYGNTPQIKTTTSEICPNSLCSLAKYAAEEILRGVMEGNAATAYTILRMDSIAGYQRVLPLFIRQTVETGTIKLKGGSQQFSYLDVKDAALAIQQLLHTQRSTWKHTYNVGCNQTVYTIAKLAEFVAEIAKEFGVSKPYIELECADIELYAGMDSTEFYNDTGWKPVYNIGDIVRHLFEEYFEYRQGNGIVTEHLAEFKNWEF